MRCPLLFGDYLFFNISYFKCLNFKPDPAELYDVALPDTSIVRLGKFVGAKQKPCLLRVICIRCIGLIREQVVLTVLEPNSG